MDCGKKWKSAFVRCMEQTISNRKPVLTSHRPTLGLTLSWLG